MVYIIGVDDLGSILRLAIYPALKANEKEVLIQIENEAGESIASAEIDLSKPNLSLDILTLSNEFKEANKENINLIITQKETLLKDIESELAQIDNQHQNLRSSLRSCIEQLKKYKDLFTQYPIQASGLHDFLRENPHYDAVFVSMLSVVSQYPDLQEPLSLLFAAKSNDKSIFAYLSETKNALLLKFLIEALPNFEPIHQAWESYKVQRDHADEESHLATDRHFNAKRHDEYALIINDKARLRSLIKNTLAAYFVHSPEKLIANESLDNALNILLRSTNNRTELFDLARQVNNSQRKEENINALISIVMSIINNPDLYLKLRDSKIQPHLDLSARNLQFSRLERVRMRETNFSQADLSQSAIKNSTFFNSNFSGANLNQADLQDSEFNYCNFAKADLTGANLTGVSLEQVNWAGVKLSNETILDWNLYGTDILLANLKAIGNNNELSLPQKKAAAKEWVDFITQKISSNKSMLKLVDIIDKKHSDYAYLREEQAFWRFNSHGNTTTWHTVLGYIKDKMDKNVSTCGEENYSADEYQTFLRIMSEHRGRGLGSVTHASLYEQRSSAEEAELIHITKRPM
ncbi:Type III effector pipB2 [Legionella massiliensis]|uniref:Type III effector pipB2 n=1 Tax=Legionella massiliensis TaxID=1034943 RepID=A0A078KXW4_9GAMM|nr:pentapeptide repeat-containing protein [Legionella massiliensis]CDZ79275.1 Type III effector pipB2 [Legionella massiliensis]CEE15013.1 Secreted effector protein pipB2 [Legionella massiliensis]